MGLYNAIVPFYDFNLIGMEVLKWFGLITAFSVFFLKISYVRWFLFWAVKSFLSWFCVIWVSSAAVEEASSWLLILGLLYFCYFVYQKFFK